LIWQSNTTWVVAAFNKNRPIGQRDRAIGINLLIPVIRIFQSLDWGGGE
jgi:hypothetical protein